MRATLVSFQDLDRVFRDDTDESLTLSPTESRAELWLAWVALLPSKRPAFLDEQDDDAREWLLHLAEITGAVDLARVELLARPVGKQELAAGHRGKKALSGVA